jgi:hypothetical protein
MGIGERAQRKQPCGETKQFSDHCKSTKEIRLTKLKQQIDLLLDRQCQERYGVLARLQCLHG